MQPPKNLAGFARTRIGAVTAGLCLASFGFWFGIVVRDEREMRRVRDALVEREVARRLEAEAAQAKPPHGGS